MFHIYAILGRLLQTIAAIINKVVDEDRFCSFFYPDRATLLILFTTPSAINNSIIVNSHLGKRNSLAIAGIREFEGVGAGVVDNVVGNIELAASLHIDSLATISRVTAICKDIVDDNTITACEVSLVVVVVVEETVGHHKLTIHITEVESWYTTIDSGLEELVLERSRTLGRSSASIGNLNMVEHHLV